MAPRNRYNGAKISELLRKEGVPSYELPLKLEKLGNAQVPDYVDAADDQRAEQLMLGQQTSKTYKKPMLATKSRLESYAFKNATAALSEAVSRNERAGVVQALLRKAGPSSTVKNSSTRQTLVEQRSKLLEKAVSWENSDSVWLLLPEATYEHRNEGLAQALNMQKQDVIEKLLQYQADPNHCHAMFSRAARQGDHTTVGLLLRGTMPLKASVLDEGLVQAVRSGSLQTVSYIVQVAKLEDKSDSEAVQEAVGMHRGDILCTLLRHAQSLQPGFLDRLVRIAFEDENIAAPVRTTILESLFYAGASGDGSASSLASAVGQNAMGLVNLFLKHGVDVNWDKAASVRRAVREGSLSFVRRLSRDGRLSAQNASHAVAELPSNIPSETRFQILQALLQAGAHGDAINRELETAVQKGEETTIELLRNSGASANYQDGAALVGAIKCGRVSSVKLLLRGPVDPSTLQAAFPHLRSADKLTRRLMTKLLLRSNASGEVLDVALRDAVCDQSEDRDPELINMLLQGGADPTFNNAHSLRQAIDMCDPHLFKDLLRCLAQVSSGIVSSLVAKIAQMEASHSRLLNMRYAIEAEADTRSISNALCFELSRGKADFELITLLASRGSPDINYHHGKALSLAATKHDLKFLSLLKSCPDTSRQTIRRALVDMLEVPTYSDHEKASRAKTLLEPRRTADVATQGFTTYLQHCRTSLPNGRSWPLKTFEVLLEGRADINSDHAQIIVDLIAEGCVPLLGLAIQYSPKKSCLDRALLKTLKMPTKIDRDEACAMILGSGPSILAASKALVEASSLGLADLSKTLLDYGALCDHESYSAIRVASAKGDLDVLKIFLAASPSQDCLAAAFEDCSTLENPEKLCRTMRAILKGGLRGPVIDEYLLHLTTLNPTPTRLVNLLLGNGASVHHGDSACLVLAATSGNLTLLELLFTKSSEPETATICFEACYTAGLIKAHHFPIHQSLLEKGAKGISVDQALVVAVEELQDINIDVSLVKLLASHHVNVDFEDGRALCRACEMGRNIAVSVLLQLNPSIPTKSRALSFLIRSSAPPSIFSEILDMLMCGSAPGASNASRTTRSLFVPNQDLFKSPLKLLLSKQPNDASGLQKVLDYGCPKDSNILRWALEQSTPKISDNCMIVLAESGANVRYGDSAARESIIHMAVRARRPALIRVLLKHGSDASATDHTGFSPLMTASRMSEALAVSCLLESGVATNDGSLHEAARSMNLEVVKLLLKHQHDPARPSAAHQGRTALGELCFGTQAAASDVWKLKQIIGVLIEAGADATKHVNCKPLICLALDNDNPPPIVQALFDTFLWGRIDEDFNLFTDEKHCFSPTMYVDHGLFLGPQERKSELLALLRQYNAKRDVFYALSGPQPAGAKGMPLHLQEEHNKRMAKADSDREREENLQRSIREKKEQEKADQEIMNMRHREQLARDRGRHWQEQDLARRAHERKQSIRQQEHDRDLQRTRQRYDVENAQIRKRADHERQAALEQERIAEHRMNAELEYRSELGRIESSNLTERLRIEQENTTQTLYKQQKAIEARVNTEKGLRNHQDGLHERQHERAMKQLAMQSAVATGPPMIAMPERLRITDA